MALSGVIGVITNQGNRFEFPFTPEGMVEALDFFRQYGCSVFLTTSNGDLQISHLEVLWPTEAREGIVGVLIPAGRFKEFHWPAYSSNSADLPTPESIEGIPFEVYNLPFLELFVKGQPTDTRACSHISRVIARSGEWRRVKLGSALQLSSSELEIVSNLGLKSIATFHRRLKDRDWLQFAKSKDFSDSLPRKQKELYQQIVNS